MILVIDNYDSFTYNLVQYLGELGAEVRVRRNDQATLDRGLAEPAGFEWVKRSARQTCFRIKTVARSRFITNSCGTAPNHRYDPGSSLMCRDGQACQARGGRLIV